ncbi:MAG: SsrA-binding protein SmpB [Spirochaetales bacterium]|nr:SsrA-binding protein SmpB [Spirochaetales bacterium]
MKDKIKILAKNKKAGFNYTVDETIECGIVLLGTEVKSIKSGRFSFSDSYVRVKGNRLELVGFHIAQYPMGTHENHDPDTTRTLLVHKQEIKKLARKTDEKGFSMFPLALYLKGGLIKVEIGIGKGKRSYDKRQVIKDRDLNREAERELRRN